MTSHRPPCVSPGAHPQVGIHLRPTNKERTEGQQQPRKFATPMKPACAPAVDHMANRTGRHGQPAAKPVELHAKASVRAALVNRRLGNANGRNQGRRNGHSAEAEQQGHADRMVDQGRASSDNASKVAPIRSAGRATPAR